MAFTIFRNFLNFFMKFVIFWHFFAIFAQNYRKEPISVSFFLETVPIFFSTYPFEKIEKLWHFESNSRNSRWSSFPRLHRWSRIVSTSLRRPPGVHGYFVRPESNTGRTTCGYLYMTSRGPTTQSPTSIALRRPLWLDVFSSEGRRRLMPESSLQWRRACLIYERWWRAHSSGQILVRRNSFLSFS